MALVKTFDANDLKEEFRAWERDYFSYEACEAMIQLFEDCDCGTNTELDIVALCCDFNEEDWEDIKENYSNHDDIAECETIEELLDALNYYTWAIQTTDNQILYQCF